MLRMSHVSSHLIFTFTLWGGNYYLSPFHRGKNWGLEKSSALSKVTQLVSGRTETQIKGLLTPEPVLPPSSPWGRESPMCVHVWVLCVYVSVICMCVYVCVVCGVCGCMPQVGTAVGRVLPSTVTWGFLRSTGPCLFVGSWLDQEWQVLPGR